VRKALVRLEDVHEVIQYDSETRELFINHWHAYNLEKVAQLLEGHRGKYEGNQKHLFSGKRLGLARAYRASGGD
jgi:hypothetical protein